MKIIFPSLSYKEALRLTNLELLSDRREKASHVVFDQIKNPSNSLNNLLTVKEDRNFGATTRNIYPYVTPCPKTNRLSKSLIVYGLLKRW